jgi:hypothetical protein
MHMLRRVTEAFARARSRIHLARLDRLQASRCQLNTLLGLVHRAQITEFGRQHDFRRIRTEADYRRLVPVTTSALLGRDPSDPAFLASQRAAWRTALALTFGAHPHGQLLSGSLLFLDQPQFGLPRVLRPYCVTATGIAPDDLAQRSMQLPLTAVFGSLAVLSHLFERVKTLANRDRIAEAWPKLLAVWYSRGPHEQALAGRLREELGSKISLLEIGRFPEGIAAVHDPRHNLLRLLPRHGVYFEFIPKEEMAKRAPERIGLNEVQIGETYELALTSPAGVWACRSGTGVRFERLDPPLLRFVALPRLTVMPSELATQSALAETPPQGLKLPGLHRRSGGTPAALPESFAHNPWLVPVDRG